MSQTIEIKVPDIGDYKDIPVIEIHVKVGDLVQLEQSLITLESDKATMDVPSSHAGIVKELKVKMGDHVSEGSLVLVLEESTSPVSSTQSLDKLPTPEISQAPSEASIPSAPVPSVAQISSPAVHKIESPSTPSHIEPAPSIGAGHASP